jgi:hypothetical protein
MPCSTELRPFEVRGSSDSGRLRASTEVVCYYPCKRVGTGNRTSSKSRCCYEASRLSKLDRVSLVAELRLEARGSLSSRNRGVVKRNSRISFRAPSGYCCAACRSSWSAFCFPFLSRAFNSRSSRTVRTAPSVPNPRPTSSEREKAEIPDGMCSVEHIWLSPHQVRAKGAFASYCTTLTLRSKMCGRYRIKDAETAMPGAC